MAYFLKYAIDNEWIGSRPRDDRGADRIGICCLGRGAAAQRYAWIRVTVLGGGVAILYFSIFAAFSFYHLLGPNTRLLLMVLITLLRS
jgi:uncharacterized membrane protein